MEELKKELKKFANIFIYIIMICFDLTFTSIIFLLLSKLGINVTTTNTKMIVLLISCIIYMLILYLLFRKSINKNIKDYKKDIKKYYKTMIISYVIGLFIMVTSNIIIYLIYHSTSTNEQAVQSYLKTYKIYMIFSSVIYAPFTEEILYRKMLRGIINNKYFYIIASGIIFGFLHCLSGLNNIYEILYIIPYGIMGSIFAYLYNKTDNIFIPITVHTIHNFIALILSII